MVCGKPEKEQEQPDYARYREQRYIEPRGELAAALVVEAKGEPCYRSALKKYSG